MSGQEPIRAQSRELEVLRVLLDRRLSDRAVSLAESRWPGSGEMVKLAYDWAQLSPVERRERLSAIGPEEVARMRELAVLNPELDAVVQNLDERGVLPHVEQMAASGVAAATAAATSATPSIDDSEAAVADEAEPDPVIDTVPTQPETIVDVAPEAAERVDAVTAAAQERIEQLRREAEELQQMDPADLAAQGTRLEAESSQVAEFLSVEQQRREQALTDAQAALDRVRQRVERSSNKLLTQSDTPSRTPPAVDLPPGRGPGDFGSLHRGSFSALPAVEAPSITPAPERLAREFAGQVVITIADRTQIPTGDELIALANDMGLALREFAIEPGATRAIFGGLKRRGYQIEAEAGPLPSALAQATLAVVRGKLYPSLAERMEQGFADIPTTRATVRMHPKSRVLVLLN